MGTVPAGKRTGHVDAPSFRISRSRSKSTRSVISKTGAPSLSMFSCRGRETLDRLPFRFAVLFPPSTDSGLPS